MQVHLQAEGSLAGQSHFENQIQKVQTGPIAKVIAENPNVLTVVLRKGNHRTVTANHLSKNAMTILHQEENHRIAERIHPDHVKHLTESQMREASVQVSASKNLTSLTGKEKKVHPDPADLSATRGAVFVKTKADPNRAEDLHTETEETHRHHDHAKHPTKKIQRVEKDQRVVSKNHLKRGVTHHPVRAEQVASASRIQKVVIKNLTSLSKKEMGIHLNPADLDAIQEVLSAASAKMTRILAKIVVQ